MNGSRNIGHISLGENQPRPLFRERTVLIYAGNVSGGGRLLGLGDLIRVVALVPEFQARRVDWCSDRVLFRMIRDCGHITALFEPSLLKGRSNIYDDILNLTTERLPLGPTAVHEFSEWIAGEGELKRHTYDLLGIIAGKLRLPSTGHMPVAQNEISPVCDVGFNWRTPPEWETKALPEAKWHELERILTPRFRISWQPDSGALEDYIKWVKRCRLLVSVVGFGCHIAMYYGIKLIMLSGPTDFAEAHHYRNGRVLYPPSRCEHRPCYRKVGEGCCGSMADFGPADIAEQIFRMLPWHRS